MLILETIAEEIMSEPLFVWLGLLTLALFVFIAVAEYFGMKRWIKWWPPNLRRHRMLVATAIVLAIVHAIMAELSH
jgi:uncharacterized membrane protein YvlD (DUF360 family)